MQQLILLIVAWMVGLIPMNSPAATVPLDTGSPTQAMVAGESAQISTREALKQAHRAVGLMEWAQSRFEAGGLSMPENVDLIFYDTQDECGGNLAVFKGDDSGGVIAFCLRDDAPEMASRRILLHELSHAWTARNLSEDAIDDFLGLRGLQHWSEPAPWELRGTEHAAEIIAWGLFDAQIGVAGIYPNDTAGLTEAFHLLTGKDPICGREQ